MLHDSNYFLSFVKESAVAAEEQNRLEVNNLVEDEAEEVEDGDYSGAEEEEDISIDLEEASVESGAAEEEVEDNNSEINSFSMEEAVQAFKKMGLTPAKTPKKGGGGAAFKELVVAASYPYCASKFESSNTLFCSVDMCVPGGSTKTYTPGLVDDGMAVQVDSVVPSYFFQKGRLLAAHPDLGQEDHRVTEFKQLCDRAKQEHATYEGGKPKFVAKQKIKLPFKCVKEDMQYELQAFTLKDKDFTKEHRGAAKMFVFSILLKAAKQPERKRANQGTARTIAPYNDSDDSDVQDVDEDEMSHDGDYQN